MADDRDEDNFFDVDYMIDIFEMIGINYTFSTIDEVVELLEPYNNVNWDSNNRTSLTSKTVVFKSLHSNPSLTKSDIVTLIINERKLDVNKKVLALHSEYFNTMFSSNFNEKYQNKKEFHIADISYTTLKTIVEYMTGIELSITEHNVQDLLIGSSILMMHDVQEVCEDYFKTVIDTENCIVIKTFADALDLKDLYNLCLNFIVKNFRFVANNPEFMNFSYEEVLFIVRSNDLHAKEIQVYEAVINWIRYNPISRVKCTVELLWYVRFPLILNINDESSAYYDLTSHRMIEDELFRTQYRNPERKGILLLSYKPLCFNWYDATIGQWHPYYATTSCACATFLNIFRPRETSSYLMLDSGNIFCVGGKTTKQSSYVFNPETKFWVHLKITNFQHIKPYMVQIGFKIFVISDGNIRNRMVNTIEFFHIKEKDWVTVPFSIKKFHMDFTYITHARGLIYIISSNKAVYYDPENNIFQGIRHLPRRIRDAAICTLNNNVYIIGGKYKGQYLNSVYAYCTETKVWVSIADMNCPRSQPGVVVMNGSIHVFGGINDTNSCSNTFEVYNSHKDEWVTSTATMNTACYNIDAFVLEKDNTLYKSIFNDSNIRF